MSNKQPQISGRVKIPMTLPLRDVVLVMAAVVSIVTAWGMFGTRLSVAEEKLVSIGNNLNDIRQLVKDIRQEDKGEHKSIQVELDNVEKRLRYLEEQQARVESIIKNQKKGP